GERQQDQRRGDAQHDVEHRLLDGTTGAMPVRTVLRRCGVLGGTVEGERGHQASLRLLMRNWITVTVMQIRNSTIATAEEKPKLFSSNPLRKMYCDSTNVE